ncbi:MAG: transcription elongation factor GreA [Candidatus Paceibacterota bacterium]
MIQYLTKESLQKAQDDLEKLKKHGRKKISDQLKQAIEFGDLSENASYTAAKDAQANLERKILELENLIKNAIVVEKNTDGTIQIGSTIKVKENPPAGGESEIYEYTIVGTREADPGKNLISNESPLGKAFLGKKKGEAVDVQTPSGISQYEIVEVK